MQLPYLSYKVPSFNKLVPGQIEVHVPMVKQAVQIGTSDVSSQELLAVTVDPPEVRIEHKDGLDFNVEQVSIDRNRQHRMSALAVPISRLVIRQTEDPTVWSAAETEGLRVYDDEILRYFIELVGQFAYLRQEKNMQDGKVVSAAEMLRMYDN